MNWHIFVVVVFFFYTYCLHITQIHTNIYIIYKYEIETYLLNNQFNALLLDYGT